MAFTTELWTDGACSGNPGPGGWAFILIARGEDGTILKQVEGRGGEPHTTNNRMELRAAVEGLRALKRPTAVTVHPDSAYLSNAFIDGWIENWQRNGWRSGRKPVKNQDLWRELLDVIEPHTVRWERVDGHASSALNNRCDRLAVHERDVQAGRIPRGQPAPAS